MVPRHKISELIQASVRQRAKYQCEYCHACEQWQYVKFTIDHVVPISKGGTSDPDNLALACFHCNRQKTNRLFVMASEAVVALFNPRLDDWSQHFIWSADGLLLIGLTEIGKATVLALAMNRERVLNIRAADREVGRHPPEGDPVVQAPE